MTTLIHEEKDVTTRTMTRTDPPKWLLAFSRWRLIILTRNNLTVRVSRQPEADCCVGVSGKAFKFSGEIQQIAANVC